MKKSSIALTGGNIMAPEAGRAPQQGILIEDGIVSCLESDTLVAQLARDRGIPVVDVKGATLMPGPTDTHFHLLITGLHLSSIDFKPCRSIDEVLQLIRENRIHGDPEAWILGKNLDEFNLKEKRPPTSQELDRVAKDLPVFLEDRGIHYSQLNTLAFKRLGIPLDAPGVIKHVNENAPTGQLMEEIAGQARQNLLRELDEDYKRRIIWEGARFAAACGITALHAIEGGEISGDNEIPLLLRLRDELPVKMSLHWNTLNIEAVKDAGLHVVGGDIWLDGALGAHTAALVEPYADYPQERGLLYYTAEQIEPFIRQCLAEEIQVGFHAIGDRAIEQILSAFEAVIKDGAVQDRLFRIDHFGIPTKEHIHRAADIGVVISTQPTFPYLRGGSGSVYESRLGPKRLRRAYPLRELIDAGLLVAGASDSNVLPAEVMLGIHSTVNHPYTSQRLTVDEAVRLYTLNAARLEFEENSRGSLSAGKEGDLIVLDENPYEVDTSRIRDIKVTMTIVNGVIVYDCTKKKI
jgi:predicted amidohydrolase YtcJ